MIFMEAQEKKEIDLIDIIQVIFNYIRKFFLYVKDVCVWLVRFLFQAKWFLIIAVACGIAFSFYASRKSNLFYKGEVEMRFNIYDAYFYKNLTNFLNVYLKEENRASLVQTLQISPEVAANLALIDSYFFIDNSTGVLEVDYANKFETQKDTTIRRINDRLMLVVVSRDTTIYPDLLGKIKYFFENNPTVLEENAIRLQQIDQKIGMLNNEIVLLDSLRKKEYFKKETGSQAKLDQTILLSEKERRLYHNDILGLEYTIQGLQWEKTMKSDGVRFLTPFRVDPVPVNRLSRMLIKYVPVVFILGFFIALGWKYRKKMYQFLSEKE